MFRFLTVLLLTPIVGGAEPTEVPEAIQEILYQRCFECHDADSEKGDVNLDRNSIDWGNLHDMDLWLRVYDALDHALMPPPEKEDPTREEKELILGFLREKMLEQIPIGGTLPRRLNRREYEQTIRDLFHLRSFKLPLGFPGDSEFHGFDNVSEGLVLSPAHLEAYSKVAAEIADELFPPKKEAPEIRKWEAGPEDMVLSFSAASVHEGALRLVSRSIDVMRSCTWPSRIEITDSGNYRISLQASQFLSDGGHPFEQPMKLEIYAREVSASDRSTLRNFRLLHTMEVTSEIPQSFSFEADLYEGETILLHWANAEVTHQYSELTKQLEAWFAKDPRFLAAWQKAVFPGGDLRRPRTTALRGRNGWNIISRHWTDPELDLSEATMDSKKTEKLLELSDSLQGTFNFADALCHFYHNHGPALEFHQLTIEGPSRLVESPKDRARKSLQENITGVVENGQSNETIVRAMLERFLPAAFRRPVDAETVERYFTIASDHLEAGYSLDEAFHLLVRNILISPRFLYRSTKPGRLDDFDLATRLSYFLTQGPPDSVLVDLAQRNRLSASKPAEPEKRVEYWVLRREAERLLPKRETDPMIQSFVGQWLDTETLSGIMPDPKFQFDEDDTALAKRETERFFTEMLIANRPMTDFIDPDFTFSTPAFVQKNYGFTPAIANEPGNKPSNKERTTFRKMTLQRGQRHGGLLGQAAILMATANGVDTQPVIRGVWVLENILGMPPPPPPKNVPALTPDTRGSTTPRELLAAHTKASACAGCHQHIDPVGFLLENYDPVGRWRTEWPGTGREIDSTAVLHDGTEIRNAVEFKAWLVENIDLFSQCLAEKLMIYATGRVPNFSEKAEISEIVTRNRESGNGFRDLLLSLIESETFRTR